MGDATKDICAAEGCPGVDLNSQPGEGVETCICDECGTRLHKACYESLAAAADVDVDDNNCRCLCAGSSCREANGDEDVGDEDEEDGDGDEEDGDEVEGDGGEDEDDGDEHQDKNDEVANYDPEVVAVEDQPSTSSAPSTACPAGADCLNVGKDEMSALTVCCSKACHLACVGRCSVCPANRPPPERMHERMTRQSTEYPAGWYGLDVE